MTGDQGANDRFSSLRGPKELGKNEIAYEAEAGSGSSFVVACVGELAPAAISIIARAQGTQAGHGGG